MQTGFVISIWIVNSVSLSLAVKYYAVTRHCWTKGVTHVCKQSIGIFWINPVMQICIHIITIIWTGLERNTGNKVRLRLFFCRHSMWIKIFFIMYTPMPGMEILFLPMWSILLYRKICNTPIRIDVKNKQYTHGLGFHVVCCGYPYR